MKTCHLCLRHMHVDEDRCPFCETPQRATSPPRLRFMLGLGLVLSAGTTGCVNDTEPATTANDSVADTVTDGATDTIDGPTTPGGNDSVDPTIPGGEGSTYAGPDETDSWWDSDGNGTTECGTTTGGESDSSSSGGSSTTTGNDTITSDSWGEGSTYAGPDESDSSTG